MTAHELARKLLDGPDLPVMIPMSVLRGLAFTGCSDVRVERAVDALRREGEYLVIGAGIPEAMADAPGRDHIALRWRPPA